MDKIYLNDIWSFYFHDPYNMEWTIKNYKWISNISNIEDFIYIYICFKDIINKGMFFLMREHISPIWEDEYNIHGGCLSFKLFKANLEERFFEISSQLLGETLGKNQNISENINGISISPKKNYYIIRIWIKNSELANKENYNITIPKFSTLMYRNHKNNIDEN